MRSDGAEVAIINRYRRPIVLKCCHTTFLSEQYDKSVIDLATLRFTEENKLIGRNGHDFEYDVIHDSIRLTFKSIRLKIALK